MKLLFSSDLHGDEGQYARLLQVGRREKPNVLILGGDCLPDDSPLDRPNMGVGQPKFVRQQFKKFAQDFRELTACTEILTIFGNHDWTSSSTAMQDLATDGLVQVLTLSHQREFSGLTFVGYSSTPPTPWFVKDYERLDQPGDIPPLLGGARWDPRFNRPGTHSATHLFCNVPTIADELAALKVPKTPWVFVCHAPPFDTKLDRAFGPRSLGSRAIRALIERQQPVLSLHGHIHEAPAISGDFKQTIGRTIAVNAGQGRSTLNYAVIEIDPSAPNALQLRHGREA